ncbi:BofC C-terminal domain-containing protein [Ferviditalea candida]|uniref:BofC C-terminal domain-containing protein n=1 Tax=Ferviditalea candida TaxID=3108399 RepID=A0ABU5ZHU2_9BACL|nr:BofC C-terminal domain-containing protein [Paenibacillaceae bacterium T2]
MNYSNLLKRIKKRLRRKRRGLSLGFLAVLIGMSLTAGIVFRLPSTEHALSGSAGQQAVSAMTGSKYAPQRQERTPLDEIVKGMSAGSRKQVSLHTVYACGEQTERLGAWSAGQIGDAYAKNPDWNVESSTGNLLTFSRKIDDLSPECKRNAYFGVDQNGNLSLFNGLPANDQVIRTFFQLNIKRLKSSLPHETVRQLYDGIRVTDLAEYNSVLSTFSDFAVEETKKVMTPSF